MAILSVLIVLSGVTTLFISDVYAESVTTKADAAIVVSASTGEVVYGLHQDRKLNAGGFSKLMTAMVVIDRMHDDSEYKNVIKISEASNLPDLLFKIGDEVTVRDLMHAMLMEDSGEAALALALYSCGSKEEFVNQMNAKAQELRLASTRYTNVTGAYQGGQYSTAADTANLIKAAMEYADIREILNTPSYSTEMNTTVRQTYTNTDELKLSGLESVKHVDLTAPRYTTNYFAIARRDGMELLTVMLYEPAGSAAKDAAALMEYGYANVTSNTIVKAGKRIGVVKVRHGARTIVPVYTAYKGYVYVPKEGSDSLIETRTVIDSHLKAPVKAGTKAGEYRIYVADELMGKVDLIVKDDIKTGWLPSYIYISNIATIVSAVVLLLVIYIIGRIRSIRKKRRRMAQRKRQQKIRELAEKQFEIDEDRRRRNWTYH